MLDKIKKVFKEKDEKKRIDNLVAFLIILVITLIIINKILSSDDDLKKSSLNENGVTLVNKDIETKVESSNIDNYNLEDKLEQILSQIQGIGKVKVLLTYSETSSISPLYNKAISSSSTTDSNRKY